VVSYAFQICKISVGILVGAVELTEAHFADGLAVEIYQPARSLSAEYAALRYLSDNDAVTVDRDVERVICGYFKHTSIFHRYDDTSDRIDVSCY